MSNFIKEENWAVFIVYYWPGLGATWYSFPKNVTNSHFEGRFCELTCKHYTYLQSKIFFGWYILKFLKYSSLMDVFIWPPV